MAIGTVWKKIFGTRLRDTLCQVQGHVPRYEHTDGRTVVWCKICRKPVEVWTPAIVVETSE